MVAVRVVDRTAIDVCAGRNICSIMSERTSIKKNLGYQTVYQILNTCLPLITSPYLARVLGAEKQGVFSYTQSIVNYFTLFAMLGVANYGTRTIAACREDKDERTHEFWNIYALQAFVSLIAIILYLLYIFLLCKENVLIASIQGLYLLGSFLDINWVFFGIEKFKTTVSRSIFIRITSVVLILLLVNNPDDLWIYAIIMAGGTALSNGILWCFLPQEINMRGISYIQKEEVKKHIKPNFVLFIPLLAMSVYHIMDKTMLGILSTYEQVGFYYNADKVINIPIGVISGVGTVMLPRTTALIAENRREEANKLFTMSVESVFAVSTAMAFGIAAISNEFTPFFFGKGFEPCIILIIVLAPVLIIKGLSQTSRMQYLIPSHNEKIFIQSVFLGAAVNLAVNYLLISKMGAMGAVVGTLVAELVTCIWQYVKMNKSIKTMKTILKSSIYLLFGILMFVAVRVGSRVFDSIVLSIAFEFLIGVIVYGGLCLVFWKFTHSQILGIILRRK